MQNKIINTQKGKQCRKKKPGRTGTKPMLNLENKTKKATRTTTTINKIDSQDAECEVCPFLVL